MYRYLLVILLLAGCSFAASAQQPDTSSLVVKRKTDSVNVKKRDTVPPVKKAPLPPIKKEKVYHPDSTHNPHTAVMHSLMVPGWGQLYNHRWWKVPVIYGGMGLLGWAVVFNEKYYKQFLALAQYLEHGVKPGPKDKYYNEYNLYVVSAGYQASAINNATDSYRRDRDLSILGLLGAWGINVIDAYIDAKFIHSYTVDNDLSMKISPGLINQQPVYAQNLSNSFIPAIKITFTLK